MSRLKLHPRRKSQGYHSLEIAQYGSQFKSEPTGKEEELQGSSWCGESWTRLDQAVNGGRWPRGLAPPAGQQLRYVVSKERHRLRAPLQVQQRIDQLEREAGEGAISSRGGRGGSQGTMAGLREKEPSLNSEPVQVSLPLCVYVAVLARCLSLAC